MNGKRPRIPPYKVNQIAGATPADPRTVRKVISGRPVRGGVGDRIKDQIRQAGYVLPDDDEDGDE